MLGGIGLILLGAAVVQAVRGRPASARLWLVLFGAYALAAFIAGYVLPPPLPASWIGSSPTPQSEKA